MELSRLTKVEVATLDKNASPVQITVKSESETIQVEEIHTKVCKELGLEEKSKQYFFIFEGKSRPKKRYKNIESIKGQITEPISVQKWCFDMKIEQSVLMKDPAALHLLYVQAMHEIETGNLIASAEDIQKLEEYSDPGFPVENQYVSLCQSLPHYNAVQFRGCCLDEVFTFNSVVMENGMQVCVWITKLGLELHPTVNNKSSAFLVPWQSIKSWKKVHGRETVIGYEIGYADTCWLYLNTDQALLMLDATMSVIKVLQMEDQDQPFFTASMISREKTKDDIAIMAHWVNVLHKPGGAEVQGIPPGLTDITTVK
ncbi:uncharacterized protein LOC106174472 isoform X1 [Lingula anatina]|uniref:Uncharacterized protein LOC106174472 isoform X1 n=1 Tax=Lingula anatina TaxID=7574 RepID=A0A1S3JMX0_LINAN|nr:uncharacterized protein LOC106174472 isoform X1 [Lingula anatina]|eukprot:XP_013411501.1 uncharacterized protein LOC106174472 isoform X1 [Lingula anatina]